MARETQPRVAAARRRRSAPMTRLDPSRPSAVRFLEPRVGPIEKATDLGSVQVLKHGNLFLLTDQFGDIHSDSRGLGPLPQRHAAAVLLRAPRRRRAAGRPPGLDRRELPGRRSSSRTRRSTATPTTRSGPGQGLVGRKLGITRERLVSGDVLRGADHDRQLRRATTRRSRSRSSWPTTRPTSSRSAAIPATAGRCCRSPPTTSGRRSATTASTATAAGPTSPSPSRARSRPCGRTTAGTSAARSATRGAGRSARAPRTS